jgi:hypothetical protein
MVRQTIPLMPSETAVEHASCPASWLNGVVGHSITNNVRDWWSFERMSFLPAESLTVPVAGSYETGESCA